MQKLKNSLIETLISKKATSKEIDFLIYISHFQDDTGKVDGIFYQDICKNCKMSFQSFYNALYSLEAKGIISISRASHSDYDIKILNNDFSSGNFKDGYISTGHKIFSNPKFLKLKANEKIMALDLMRITYINRKLWKIGRIRFYERYEAIFGTTRRVVQNYIKSLRLFFSFTLKEANYHISPNHRVLSSHTSASDSEKFNEHIIKTACRRFRIQSTEKDIKDSATLINQYKNDFKCNIISSIYDSIKESIQSIGKSILEPRVVHKILRSMI